jgi:hypothetical protein
VAWGTTASLPNQVGSKVEGPGEREARELVQPQAPSPGEVELNDAGIPLPDLLLLAGDTVDEEGGRSGAEELRGVVDECGREWAEAADDGDGVAWVEERLGERGGDVVPGRCGGRRREGEEARVGAERGAAGEEAREGGGGGEAPVERHVGRQGHRQRRLGGREVVKFLCALRIYGGAGFRVLGRVLPVQRWRRGRHVRLGWGPH